MFLNVCSNLGDSQCCSEEAVNYRIVEWFGLEMTFKDHVVQLPCYGQEHLLLDQDTRSLIQTDHENFQ